jgi:hypothetical protein
VALWEPGFRMEGVYSSGWASKRITQGSTNAVLLQPIDIVSSYNVKHSRIESHSC